MGFTVSTLSNFLLLQQFLWNVGYHQHLIECRLLWVLTLRSNTITLATSGIGACSCGRRSAAGAGTVPATAAGGTLWLRTAGLASKAVPGWVHAWAGLTGGEAPGLGRGIGRGPSLLLAAAVAGGGASVVAVDTWSKPGGSCLAWPPARYNGFQHRHTIRGSWKEGSSRIFKQAILTADAVRFLCACTVTSLCSSKILHCFSS